ncbi:MAG: DEAD/DEAH box helicase [Candidatus Lokiarchaeota archaeon]|nr:DEAD/DEAH box helicase [Candidatus Lokiarchaeota archaeon]
MIKDFEEFIQYLQSEEYYQEQISYVQHIPARKAIYGEVDKPLRKRLTRWMEAHGLELWKHQAKAINSIRKGQNTVIVTSTASGKSLCYNLSVLDAILNEPSTTALYVFPTKALARDQHATLQKMMKETNIKTTRVGIYDGSIEPNEKRFVLDNANVIITNPFGLHLYLPWFKKKWRRICQNLKFIVLDEVHTYKGIFGSNFAMLMRRLLRILSYYGVKPQWILSSATINHPKKFAEKLVGEVFSVIDKDDSPMGPKKVILWDLPYDEISEKYRSSHQETKNLFVSHLKKGIQTLMFTQSRKMAELQAIWAKQSLPEMGEFVASYRAGISKKKRKEIEHALKTNRIMGVSSTNALELGIDIGSLDATICSGFPGTISSFWQQVGRAGRGENLSISTLIPMQDPLDLFYVHNPDLLFGPNQEEVLITLKNRYIIKNHLCCAAKEIPLNSAEYSALGMDSEEEMRSYLDELVKDSLLLTRAGKYYWRGDFFPNERYTLSNLSDKNYNIFLRGFSSEEYLTTEDESYVFRDLHPGAVYLYEAETYVVDDLDLLNRRVYIKRANVDYYTQSLKHTDIKPLELLREKNEAGKEPLKVFFGTVKVSHEYHSYKIVDTLTQETRSRIPLNDMPIVEFETQSVWFLVPFEFQKALELEGYDLGGTVHAVEHAMIAMAPALAQISRWDLGGVSIDFDPINQQPIIFIYDAFRGGIGISELLFEHIVELMKLARNLIKTCSCTSSNGCACCVMSPKCGNMNDPLDKKGALFMLNLILRQSINKKKD